VSSLKKESPSLGRGNKSIYIVSFPWKKEKIKGSIQKLKFEGGNEK
jgi:hypothetical protein